MYGRPYCSICYILQKGLQGGLPTRQDRDLRMWYPENNLCWVLHNWQKKTKILKYFFFLFQIFLCSLWWWLFLVSSIYLLSLLLLECKLLWAGLMSVFIGPCIVTVVNFSLKSTEGVCKSFLKCIECALCAILQRFQFIQKSACAISLNTVQP